MQGHEYEHLVAEHLKSKGYAGVKVTKASGDYGVDVIAHKHGRKYAVQCKYYSAPVGVAAVQEAVAGKAMYGCDEAMVVTNSTFTKAAKELAKANNVTLLDGLEVVENKRFSFKKIIISLIAAIIFIPPLVQILIEDYKNGDKSSFYVLLVILATVIPVAILYIFIMRLYCLKNKAGKTIVVISVYIANFLIINSLVSLPTHLKNGEYSDFFLQFFIMVLLSAILFFIIYIPYRKRKDLNKKFDELKKEEDALRQKYEDTFVNDLELQAMLNGTYDEYRKNLEENSSTEEDTVQEEEQPPTYSDEDLKKAISNWIDSKNIEFTYVELTEEEMAEKIKESDEIVKQKMERVGEKLVSAFKSFRVNVELKDMYFNRHHIVYKIRPLEGVKIDSVKKALPDVSLAVSVRPFEMIIDSKNGLIQIYTPVSIVYPDEEDELHPKLKRSNLEKAIFEFFKDGNVSAYSLEKKLNYPYIKALNIIDILKDNHILGKKEHLYYLPLMTAEEFIKQYS